MRARWAALNTVQQGIVYALMVTSIIVFAFVLMPPSNEVVISRHDPYANYDLKQAIREIGLLKREVAQMDFLLDRATDNTERCVSILEGQYIPPLEDQQIAEAGD